MDRTLTLDLRESNKSALYKFIIVSVIYSSAIIGIIFRIPIISIVLES